MGFDILVSWHLYIESIPRVHWVPPARGVMMWTWLIWLLDQIEFNSYQFCYIIEKQTCDSGGCFTNSSWALKNNLAKLYYARNHIYGENIKLKLCACAQSKALGTRTKFQLEILIRSMISAIHILWENIFKSSQNVSETNPWFPLSQENWTA